MANIKDTQLKFSWTPNTLVVGKDPIFVLIDELPDTFVVEGSPVQGESAYYGFKVICPNNRVVQIARSRGSLKSWVFGGFRKAFKFVAPKHDKSVSVPEQDALNLKYEVVQLAKWLQGVCPEHPISAQRVSDRQDHEPEES